jgi:hypothetical protein
MDDDQDIDIESPQDAEDEGPREAWDRMKDESVRAYAAFKMWLNSEKRSLTYVAQSSQFQCSVANLSRWSRLHDWQGRAWAFDARREQEEREQMARDRSAMRKRHLKLAMAMQSIAAHGLAELQGRIEQKLSLNLSADECKNLMAEGAKLERRTLGEDRDRRFTQIIVNLGDAPDDPDEADALLRDDTTGELIEGGALGSLALKKKPN